MRIFGNLLKTSNSWVLFLGLKYFSQFGSVTKLRIFQVSRVKSRFKNPGFWWVSINLNRLTQLATLCLTHQPSLVVVAIWIPQLIHYYMAYTTSIPNCAFEVVTLHCMEHNLKATITSIIILFHLLNSTVFVGIPSYACQQSRWRIIVHVR